MDERHIGRVLAAIRRHTGMTQRILAAKVGVSQTVISRVERGHASSEKLGTVDRIASALGAVTFLDIRYRGGEVDRLVDRAHARLVEHASALLRRAGWIVELEFSFNQFGERGSVDILAWHPVTRILLIVECKSALHDLQDLLHALSRKMRLVPNLAREARGWDATAVGRVLVVAGSSSNRGVVDAHPSIFGVAFPDRTVAVKRWIIHPDGPIAGVLFVDERRSATRRPTSRLRSSV